MLPYFKAEYPGAPGPQPTYIDPDSLTSRTTEWQDAEPSSINTTVFGAAKGAVVAAGGLLLNLGKVASGIAAAATGASTEHLTFQMRTTTHSATAYDWNGTVYYSAFFGLDVKAIDFKSLTNPKQVSLEVTRSFRLLAGGKEYYRSDPETISATRVTNYIPNTNGYPIKDVHQQ